MRTTGIKRIYLAGIVVLMMALVGCSTAKIAAYPPGVATAGERIVQQSGLVVALDPFVEKSRTEQYFDVNAVANGIAILHVRVSNNTPDRTFLVQKQDFHLIPNKGVVGGALGNKEIRRSHSTGEALAITGGVLQGLGGMSLMLAGLAMTSHSSEIQRNFVDKEMPDQTLSPGQTMEGFIYFSPVKKGEDWSHSMSAEVNLTDIKTHQVDELTVPLSR